MGCFTLKDHPTEHIHGSNSKNISWWAYEINLISSKVRALFQGKEEPILQVSQPQAASVTLAVTAETLNGSSCRVHPNNVSTGHHQSSEQSLAAVVITDKATSSTVAKEEVVLHTQTEVKPSPKVASQTSSCVCLEKPMKAKMESRCYEEEYISPDDEDVCPTCLEEYDEENPKIVTKCSHHFHLGCIYEWMERSTECPVCFKVMEFNETD